MWIKWQLLLYFSLPFDTLTFRYPQVVHQGASGCDSGAGQSLIVRISGCHRAGCIRQLRECPAFPFYCVNLPGLMFPRVQLLRGR